MIASFVTGLRTGAWLNQQRVLAYSSILLALELVTFLFFIAGTHGWIVPLERPTTTDFVSFYAAGKLALAGAPQLAYDQLAHYAAEQQATQPGIEYQFFYYPPVFLVLCVALAALPYLPAFVLFEAATLLGFLCVARAILNERRWVALVPILAFPAVFWALGLGQNSFLTAALFGLATMLIDRRPVAAGLLFGLLCYKPHVGLLVPVALAAGRRWRAFAAAAAAATALVLLSAMLFGWATWREFLALAVGAHATYETGRIDFAGFISPFGAVRLMGGALPLAYGVQAVATLAAAALVGFVWRRDLSLPTRASVLAAATPVAIPVVLVYDFLLAAVALAWTVRAGRERGFAPWEKTALAGIFAVPLLARNIAAASSLPLLPVASVLLLALVAARAAREVALLRPLDRARHGDSQAQGPILRRLL